MSDFNIQFEEQDQSITLEFEQIGGGAVKSVNGKTGVVVLDADDVGAYTKPTGGIPASDIASGVIPTVDSTLAISGAAADAKKTGDEISDLKDGLSDLLDEFDDLLDGGTIRDVEQAGWVQNRVMVSNGVLVEVPSTTFVHSAFIPLSKDVIISISDGYKVYAWRSAYSELGHAVSNVTSAWTGGTVNCAYNADYPYLVICVMRSDSSAITPQNASEAISIYSDIEVPFALKDDVDSVRFMTSTVPSGGQILYNGDTLTDSGHIVNSIAYDDGIIIGCRSNGKVVRIGYDNAEEDLLSLSGNNMDWRLCWKDSKGNVFVSPHASLGTMQMADRGLYKLPYWTEGYIKQPLSTWVTGALVVGAVGSTLTFNTNNAFRYTFAEVNPGETVRATLYTTSSMTNLYGIFTDDDLVITGRVFQSTDGVAGYKTFDAVTVPDGTTRLYIMTYYQNGYENRCNIEKLGEIRGSSFSKVISLYNQSSTVPTEAEQNDDCIWTMCEDKQGNLYVGVYAHTIRANPAIYKSTDGGNTWNYLVNFNTAGLTSNGRHVHSIVYSRWQKALYCIIGEVNTIFKSTDGGTTWTDLHVTLTDKGTVILPTEYGLLIGSDNAYNAQIDLLLNDDKTHKTVFFGWANTVFAMRRSDITGIVYAFTKVDSSVNAEYAYPPYSAITSQADLNTWKTTSGHNVERWQQYHDSVIDEYPEDAIRPQYFGILVSRDGGLHWDVWKRFPLQQNPSTGNTYIDGFWTTGQFLNGECLTGKMEKGMFSNPVIISEGKHKYVADGCDLDGEILVRTNASATVTVL